jgi:hypothetical protein
MKQIPSEIDHCSKFSLAVLLDRARHQLLSPHEFYRLCQALHSTNSRSPLYFGEPHSALRNHLNAIDVPAFLNFLDALAIFLRQQKRIGTKTIFYLRNNAGYNFGDRQNSVALKLEATLIGRGAIGQVAHLKINDRVEFAFKVFFDSSFIWQHGPWAEIPVGIRLKHCRVTKNIAEFLFASVDWAAWEWIDPQARPQLRDGITYEEFADREGLTHLNPLNLNNYNLYGIRLDPGGIQKEYRGRRSIDAIYSIFFYIRKARKEGWKSLIPDLNWKTIRYGWSRLLHLGKAIVPFFARSR